MKNIIVFIYTLISCKIGYTQNKFNLIIELDTGINSKNIVCRYYNGEKEIEVNDSFVNNTLNLKGIFYSPYISFHIEYRLSNRSYFTNDFFISEKPAKVLFQFNPKNKETVLECKTRINALPIYDTSVNKLYRQLKWFSKKESKAMQYLWDHHEAQIRSNDSISQLNKKLIKALNNRIILFLKKYPQDYFSFWYFHFQVLGLSLAFLDKDKSYLQYLLVSLKSIYPSKYINSAEGQQMISNLRGLINPPNVNSLAPLFDIKDITGNSIKLTDFKGKYVLLDFWASWCPPCIREIPFIKQLRKAYSQEKLVIIGINNDRDIADIKQAIAKYELDWINIFDDKKIVSNLFGLFSIPVTILINREGIILYDSREKEDKIQLVELLQNM